MTIIATNETQSKRSIPTSVWKDYFEQELYLECPSRHAEFHVYLTPPTNLSKDPLFVCHHGAGSSGLSFACFAKSLRRKMPDAGILSIDAREHGSIVEKQGDTADFTLDTLAADMIEMVQLTQARLWPEMPKLVLLGHSLGGAVVTRLARDGVFGAKLVGFGVIDVVEGSAIEALLSMQSYLGSRPVSFPSLEAAIEWHVRSRTIRSYESARVSTPGLVIETQPGVWTWRTDLACMLLHFRSHHCSLLILCKATQPFWEQWFTGLSAGFLAGKGAKLLILAGTDRLDKDLMIGQMQGKFQLQVLSEAGHFVQEDFPSHTADILVEFYRRNDRSALVLPPKVSDLLKQGKKV
jgi:protein phosphatase methylesterase 1